MKSKHITLRALDRLSPAEARDLESGLAGNPALAAELRATEDTIAAVWHAASPLRSAPPEALDYIHAKLHPARRLPGLPLALAAFGWAAAIILTVFLFIRPQTATPAASIGKSEITVPPSASSPSAIPLGSAEKVTRPDDQQETIRRLRQELVTLRALKSGPRFRELRAPGHASNTPPADRNRAMLDLLIAALADNLARPGESPATLVVDGWLGTDFAGLPEGEVIRHRSFPAGNFTDYGLLRSSGGDFYDPASGLLWTPAQDGGGYLGSQAPAGLDLTLFESDPAVLPNPGTEAPQAPSPNKTSPSGYLVQSDTDGGATIIIGNLPTDGTVPELIASTDGGRTNSPLTSTGIWPGVNGTAFASFSINTGMRDPSSSNTNAGTLTGLTILQRQPDGTYTTILTDTP